jgi:uncharacterized protein (TIGR03067 family)
MKTGFQPTFCEASIMRRTTGMLAFFGAFLLVTALAGGQEQKSDQERIQGEWVAVDYEDEGGKATPQELKNIVATFSANQFLVEQRRKLNTARFKLDSAKKAIDIVPVTGVNENKLLPGIYAFEKDQLKLCWSEKGQRPTEFKSGAKAGTVVLILRRRKL